ncbi:MAG: tetratricopeptide repeat protein [Acidobacteria bacterium]|nr:tetratricopeptide repeat protein [Acidobacteriota bacterium]
MARHIYSLLLVILLAAISLEAQQQSSGAMDEANTLFQAQKWVESAKAFEAITRAEPANPRAFYRLGSSLYALGQFEEAVKPFQKAIEIAHNPQPMYDLARTYARLHQKDEAFEWIDRALTANLPNPRRIANDPELVDLHEDPRFPAVAEKGRKAAMVCMNTLEYRQFDFWVGEWVVMNLNNRQVGMNSVKLLEDGCIIEENWTSAGGGTGKSFNFYNPITRKWHQSYMDSAGSNWMMDGELKDGALKYEGAIYSPGQKVLVHMTFFNLGADKVRQWAETSADEGKTWTVVWDATYVRKK